MSGILYIVSTPIGNWDDITFRALRVLTESDIILCEEYKVASRLLKNYNIKKELIEINEHTEKTAVDEVIRLLKEGKVLSLISDCGTPIFSDPGSIILQNAISSGINIVPVPGPDSIIPSLVCSGFDVSSFFYAGWLSPKKEIRRSELKKLKEIKEVIVLMETPYRLKQLIEDCAEIFINDVEACLCINLTTPDEKFIRGKINNLKNYVQNLTEKVEFVLILNNKK